MGNPFPMCKPNGPQNETIQHKTEVNSWVLHGFASFAARFAVSFFSLVILLLECSSAASNRRQFESRANIKQPVLPSREITVPIQTPFWSWFQTGHFVGSIRPGVRAISDLRLHGKRCGKRRGPGRTTSSRT